MIKKTDIVQSRLLEYNPKTQIYSRVTNCGALETLKSRHFELRRQPQTVPNWHHCPLEDSMFTPLKKKPRPVCRAHDISPKLIM